MKFRVRLLHSNCYEDFVLRVGSIRFIFYRVLSLLDDRVIVVIGEVLIKE